MSIHSDRLDNAIRRPESADKELLNPGLGAPVVFVLRGNSELVDLGKVFPAVVTV